ncbi:unnamed protein product [Tuwongella immobilis]|uniref:Uncharacterized protein n=1 Tax=Tuwongella immobilis TaxID=692036 RepID=A0A6C2YLM3_9BACT|nr:unnamed protein product [Tuwongella immobilis]VTS00156.1 unnamed protein product [Tuwongella immobilis]
MQPSRRQDVMIRPRMIQKRASFSKITIHPTRTEVQSGMTNETLLRSD